MTTQPEQHKSTFWSPAALKALADLCQSEGLNPVRLGKLVDRYAETKRKPSRQELIEALKHRPRIQVRAKILSSVTKKLNVFIETFAKDLG